MGDEIHHIQTGDALLVKVVHRMRIFLAKNGNQHIGASHFFLATAGGLHMHDGPLDHALKPQSWLGVHIIRPRHLWRVVLDEIGQRLAQVVNIGRAGPQYFGGTRVVQQRKQQMLNSDELVTLLTRLNKRHMKADFQFLGNHVFPLNSLNLMFNCNPISLPTRLT